MTHATVTRRGLLKCLPIAMALMALPRLAFAEAVSRFSLSGDNKLALVGYDTTSYFNSAKAGNGDQSNIVNSKGANWQFATPQDAALFKANPENYAPQFGGYCTRAMSLKTVVPADPEVWRIHNGKLYVFFAPPGGEYFDEGADEMITKAQPYWETLQLVE